MGLQGVIVNGRGSPSLADLYLRIFLFREIFRYFLTKVCFHGLVWENLGELTIHYLAKITLPKSVANELDSVFVPNGKDRQIWGIVPRLGGWQKSAYVFFGGVTPFAEEKAHKQIPQKIPGQSREQCLKIGHFSKARKWIY